MRRQTGLAWLPAVGLLLALTSVALWGGYKLGSSAAVASSVDEHELQRQLSDQSRAIEQGQLETRAHLDAMAKRLGEMQAELLRLEVLGGELVKAGNLDAEEFNFDAPPPRGGPEAGDDGISVDLPELLAEMELLARTISDRAHKLELAQGLIVDGRVQQSLLPSGQPVQKGWISSHYGYRKDPFTGKKAFHKGVDIAGRRGAEVLAVASGLVTLAKAKTGYGYTVEISHADGLTTRYAHNKEIFVQQGDLVEKGDIIGSVGSTGRSTGPHVHFEIARNGKHINPAKFLGKH
ncbi:MAG: peptidoglycan DD-metalloendopeptidase family protein [Gammaproteobacteria bacterium]|nr:peptidoglycan DD-metalloendopeptidase family protein [Gammaproteobacteria bacterium]